MPINLLLDTSALLRLLNFVEEDWNIARLNNWMKWGEIRLFAPEILLEEWDFHKKEKNSQIKDRVDKIKKEQKLKRGIPFLETTPEQVSLLEKRLKQQIDIIDGWLKQSGPFPESPAALEIRKQQQIESLHPFQGGKDGWKDAVIIFSTLDKLKQANEGKLFFVSPNPTDFSLMGNVQRSIHPDIQKRFPDISIYYFEFLADFLKHARKEGLVSRRALTLSDQTWVLNNFPVDPTLHPVEQLHSYLTDRFRTIRYLPRALFTRHYPLALGSGGDLYDYPVTVSTNNLPLFKFLSNVKIVDGKPENISIDSFETVERGPEKVLEILALLNFNLAQRVSWKHQTPMPIPMVDNDNSNTLTHQYRQLQFSTLWKKIAPADEETLDSLMEKGYLNYKFGNYIAAAQFYESAKTLAEEQNNYDATFFAMFSLSKLGRFLGIRVFDKNLIGDMEDELQSIDLKAEQEYCTNDQNRDILAWMSHNRFISEGIASISATVNEMAKLEYRQSRGRNENFLDIANTYLEIEYFLLYNHIVFDQFLEFSTLTDSFLRGIFASYASNERILGQIEYFPEWLLETILLNGTADGIKYYVGRYSISFIEYRIEKFDIFRNVLLPFLKNFNTMRLRTDVSESDTVRNFNEHLERLLGNALVLIAITKLPIDLEEDLLETLQAILEHWGNALYPPTLEQFDYLFQKKKDIVPVSRARKFLLTYTENKINTHEGGFAHLIYILQKNNQCLPLTDEQFKIFERNWLLPERGEIQHAWIVLSVANVLEDSKQKARVTKQISAVLKIRFDYDLFYLGDFYKLLKPTKTLLKRFETYLLERLFPPPPTGAIRRPAIAYPYAFSVDRYIHYCNEHKHPIPRRLRSGILKIDLYYSWMLGPDIFDYTNFNPQWLNHSLTKVMKSNLKRSTALKNHLKLYLKQHRDNDILRAFFELYNE